MPATFFSTPAIKSFALFTSCLLAPLQLLAAPPSRLAAQATQINSIVTLGLSPLPVSPGHPVQITATVTPSVADGYHPTGTITFWNGLDLMGTREVSYATGQAVFETNNLPLSFKGSNLTATYSGDAHLFPNGATPIHLTSKGALLPASVTSLGVAPSTDVAPGTVVTLSAAVSDGGKLITPGLVYFYDQRPANSRDTLLGQAQLTEGGVATLNLRLGAGPHNIRATFHGTQTVAGSSSAPQGVTVTGTPTPVGPGTTYGLTPTKGPFLGTSQGLVTVADFNSDGIPDVAVTGKPGILTVFLGKSDGTWMEKDTPVDGGFGSILVADFNSDGKPDLAVLTGNQLTILLGNGYGYFDQKAPVSVSSAFNVSGFVVGDFNGDGTPDIGVTFNTGKGTFAILLGRGDGRLEAPKVENLGTQAYGGATVGDFNSDGILDIASQVNNGRDGITLLLGNGDGTFTPRPVPTPVIATCAYPILFVENNFLLGADFNGDGTADLSTNYCGTNNMLLGNGDGTFRSIASDGAGNDLYPVVADMNGDGIPDLLSVVFVSLGNGDGTFTPSASGGLDLPPDTAPVRVAAGDFNGDGIADVIASLEETSDNGSQVPGQSMEEWFGSVNATPAVANSVEIPQGNH